MQASDLRRLLEMYASWQRKIFPHVSFDDFIDELEGLGKSWQLKVFLMPTSWLSLAQYHACFALLPDMICC